MSDKGYETPLCLLISLTIKCLTRDMRLYYVYKYFNYKMSDKGYETPLCLQISLTIKCLTRDMRLPLCLCLTI